MRNTLLIEAIVIGIITVILGIVVAKIMEKTMKFEKNSLLPMYIGTFVVGASLHLIFEFSGINSWWCKSVYNLK